MDLVGRTHKIYECYGYRHNCIGFCKKFTFPMSVNKGRTIIAQGAYVNFMEALSFLLFLSR